MPSLRRLPTPPGSPQAPSKFFNPKSFLAHSGIGRTLHCFNPKETIFSQGARSDAVYYIQEGRVRLSVVSKYGKEATIALFGSGDFVGEGCIAADQPFRVATATAISGCSLLRIERKEMLRTLHEERDFSDMFVAYMARSHNRMEAELVDQLFNLSEKRLARALLNLAQFDKNGEAEVVIPNVSQRTLAEMIGTTRPRVNFFMNRFRTLGFVDYNSEMNDVLTVHSSLLSVVLHE